jgi:hypothetical protein
MYLSERERVVMISTAALKLAVKGGAGVAVGDKHYHAP